jgi:inosine-uridine nucleoside N-ribohydrolase
MEGIKHNDIDLHHTDNLNFSLQGLREKWIIDTDPGCDDMVALLYMLNNKDIDIELISLCEGNTNIDNVLINIRKILKIAERKDLYDKFFQGGLPIMKGCPVATRTHQLDGLGDVEDLINLKYDEIGIPSGRSPLKIVETILKFPNQINLLFIGPLTNLALAYMLCPEISNLVKSLFIMGGTLNSSGNILPSSEFNFAYDYLAPKIILRNFKNITLVPWDTTHPHLITHEEIMKTELKIKEENKLYNKSTFFYVHKLIHKLSFLRGGIRIHDFYCAICIFNKESIDSYSVAEVFSSSDTEIMRGCLNATHKKYFKSYGAALEYIQNIKPDFEHNKLIVIQNINSDLIKKELVNLFTLFNSNS